MPHQESASNNTGIGATQAGQEQGQAQQAASQLARVRPPRYDFAAFEAKWRERCGQERIYQVDLERAEHPYYNLMMFPYPSAEGLHVGNMYSYVGSDIHGRWMAMQGYDVFEPMGFDAFGIHSENFAIKRGVHPRLLTARNVERFREQQLKRIGNRFDWSREVHTTDPRYYKWTQWIFLQLFKNGLAERKTAPVNWCPKDKTVLADEQVINGHCERCGTLVERRWLEQWFLKITAYAQRLLDNLEWLDWSERVKTIQRNWIGRSEGLEFTMALHDLDYLEFGEPFKRFRANGTITKDGTKISKSKGNVVSPDEYITRFGADVFRVYLMFMGPYDAGGDFSDRGIGGVVRFLDRAWSLVIRNTASAGAGESQGEARRILHRAIKRVTEDIAVLKYNTAVAGLMEFINSLEVRQDISREELRTLLLLMAPLAPYISEELWEYIGQTGSIHTASWPTFDEEAIRAETMHLSVQVNGRVRGRMEVAHDMPEEEIKRLAVTVPQVQSYIAGQRVSRVIYVAGRLVNIVTR